MRHRSAVAAPARFEVILVSPDARRQPRGCPRTW